MWSKRVSDLADITTICQPKWMTPSSGCQEAWDDFGWQSMGNFLRYGNIPIVATLDAEIMLVVYRGEFGRASLVHFPRRMSVFLVELFVSRQKSPR
jgi:hypothetical protein